ncbi:MAG TPA: TlpA disulfide reductase family protein [Gaiellaceae bacterium]|jgi:thiol-disulfide isomerase/thioredoxin|nr:TlpA disulfide reductase family protein [Gaiellaceae bacterium]
MTRRLRLAAEVLAVGLVVALLALLIWRVVRGSHEGVAQALAKGDVPAAPIFDLPRLDGKGRIDLASLIGHKPFVLDFWASWCTPCVSESKRLQKAHERYGDTIAFIGVDTKDFAGDARAWLRKYGITYPSVHDGSGAVLDRWVNRTLLPSIFFVDRSGKVVGQMAAEEDLPRYLRRISQS